MTIRDRIKLIMDYKGMSINKFEQTIGVSKSYLANTKGISSDAVSSILSKFPDISADWLLLEKGDMVRNLGSQDDDKPVASPTENPEEGIPLIPVSAMAGALSGEQTVLEYECERYVVPVFKGADFLIPVKGSSMYPKYSSGDIVACKRVNMSGLFFQWGKVYVIDTDQGGLIKRIKRGSDPDHILIVSDNESYEPFELPLSSVHSVAIVLGVIRLE